MASSASVQTGILGLRLQTLLEVSQQLMWRAAALGCLRRLSCPYTLPLWLQLGFPQILSQRHGALRILSSLQRQGGVERVGSRGGGVTSYSFVHGWTGSWHQIYSPEPPPSAHLHLAPLVRRLPALPLLALLALLIRLLAALIWLLLRLPARLLLLRGALLLLLCPRPPLLPRPRHPTLLGLRLLLLLVLLLLLLCSASSLLL